MELCAVPKRGCFHSIFHWKQTILSPLSVIVCAVVAAVAGVAVSDFIVLTAAAATAGTMMFFGFVAIVFLLAIALPLAPGATTVLTVAAVAAAFWLAAVVTRLRRDRADRTGAPITDPMIMEKLGLREVHVAEDLLDEKRGDLGLDQVAGQDVGSGLGVLGIQETDICVLRCEGETTGHEGELRADGLLEAFVTLFWCSGKADHHIIGYRRRRRGFHGDCC
jgi:hypothetical protein